MVSSIRPQASSGLSAYAPPPGSKNLASPEPADEVSLGTRILEAAEPRRLRKGAGVLAGIGLALTLTGVVQLMPPAPAAAVHCASSNVVTGHGREAVLQCEGVTSPTELKNPQNRAQYAFEALRAELGPLSNLSEYQGRKNITAWPLGQVLAASLDTAKLTGDYTDFETLSKQMDRYLTPGGGYAPGTIGLFGNGDRYFDDNAWIGLVYVQAYAQTGNTEYLARAQSTFGFMETGIQPDGGILWVENSESPSYNTCTHGPAIELALRLYQATGNEHYKDRAQKLTDVMDSKLRQADGMYADNYNLGSGHVDPKHYSYNQGTPIGAHLLWYQVTGDEHHLELAKQTAESSLKEFTPEGLWKASPAFNAIFLRNLIQLDPKYRDVLDTHLEHAWQHGMDPGTGLFNASDMGQYEHQPGKMGTIDQAGLTQLYALQAWPASDLHQVS